MRRLGCLLGAPLLVAYGCAGPTPHPETPATTPPAEQEYGREAPPQQHEDPPPDVEEGVEPGSPPAAGPHGTPTDVEEGVEPGSPPAAGPHGTPSGSGGGSVAQAEVEAFGDIQIALAPLQQQLAQQAQAGASQEQLQQLQGQFQQQATQIVEASALSLERFNEIATLLQRDADLQRRVQVVIQQKVEGH